MNFINLASSSAGNSYYIELERKDQEPVRLLVEAGLKYREIVKKLALEGKDISQIDAVLITHAHQDHSISAKDFSKRGMNVYANHVLASSEATTLRHAEPKIIASNTKVIPFTVEHDAEEPLGFIIETDKEKILFATDLKYFKADLSKVKFDFIFLEANYDGRVIYFAREKAKDNSNRGELKRYERIIHNHMSIANTIKTLQKLDLTRCKAVFLLHLSDRHANELLFKKQVQEAIKTTCFVCKKSGGII